MHPLACSAAAHGGQVACEVELAVRAMHNLELAQAGPVEELAQLLHRRPKPPPPEAAVALPPPPPPPLPSLATERVSPSGASLIELALRFKRCLPSRSPSKSNLGHAASTSSNIILTEEKGADEGASASACGLETPISGGTPSFFAHSEEVAVAEVRSSYQSLYTAQPRSTAAQAAAAVLDVEDSRAPMVKASLDDGGAFDVSLPASVEAAEIWITPGACLEAVALRMGDFRYILIMSTCMGTPPGGSHSTPCDYFILRLP